MPWLQLRLNAEKGDALRISDALSDAGAVAVTMQDAGDEPNYEPLPGEAPLWSNTQIVGLFPADIDMEDLLKRLHASIGLPDFNAGQIEMIEDKDWERVWMDRFQPTRFGDRLWVCPSWHTPPQPDAVNILLDPGLAFGTGTHPTTALCLEWLDRAELLDKVVIDYGCGSGVLAIAAAKLGADHVFAIDHDPQALQATAENARRNDVADRIMTLLPDQMPKVPCDVLIANILAGPLKTLAREFATQVKAGGHLVLSGILADQVDDIRQAYAPWFELTQIDNREGWMRVAGRRVGTANPAIAATVSSNTESVDVDAIVAAGRLAVVADVAQAARNNSGAFRATLWSALTSMMLVILIIQYAYFYRHDLQSYDLAQPLLIKLCDIAPCATPLRHDTSLVRMMGREVSSHPASPGALLVNATIVNDSDKRQLFPLLQLGLSDFNGSLLALRRFRPEEYLDESIDYARGMLPGVPVQVLLEIADPGADVAGFAFEFL